MNRFLVCYEQSSGSLSAEAFEKALNFGKPLKLLETAWLVNVPYETAHELLQPLGEELARRGQKRVDRLFLGVVKLDGDPSFTRTLCSRKKLQMYPIPVRD